MGFLGFPGFFKKEFPRNGKSKGSGKSERRGFHPAWRVAWLVPGILQVVAMTALEGCSSDPSLAAAPKPGGPLLSSAESGARAAGQPTLAPVPPLRVSRSFFKGSLQATLVIGSPDSPNSSTFESGVSWDNHATALPPPDPSQGPVLADFRDTVGCAVLSDLESTGICFDVMADVTDVGINNQEMRLQGPQGVSCSVPAPAGGRSDASMAIQAGGSPAARDVAGEILPPSPFRLVSARKTDKSLVLEFAPAQGASCGVSTIQLTLSQL